MGNQVQTHFHLLHEYLASKAWTATLPAAEPGLAAAELALSQKFFAGHIELIPTARITELPKLPFRSIAVEFRAKTDSGTDTSLIVLAIDGGWIKNHWIAFCFQQCGGQWLFTGMTAGERGTNRCEVAVSPAVERVYGHRKDVMSKYADAIHASVDLLCRFLVVLNCTNVETDDHLPPQKLNEKRARNGRPPVYAYKTLVLKRRKQRETFGGSRDESAVHMVRGHIKRRRTGNFWWQPFMRGNPDRGIVFKDYDASKLPPKPEQ